MLALAAVLLAFNGAACGDDDDASDDTEATDDGGTTDDGGDTDGSTDADIAEGFLDEDCQFLLAGAFLNPLAAAQGGSDEDLEAANERLQEIAEEAPDEIRDALDKIAEVYSEFAEAIRDEDIDLSDPSSFSDPDVQEAMAEIGAKFDDEAFQEASETLTQYVDENCSG